MVKFSDFSVSRVAGGVQRQHYAQPEEDWLTMDRLEDIIWSAGFMEGEGSAGFYKAAGRSSRLCLSATQKDIAPLELLKDLYGGNIIKNEDRDYYVWQSYNQPALYAIRAFVPYVKSNYKNNQFWSAVHQYLDYRAALGKERYIRLRKNGKLDVRINSNGKTINVGTFDKPDEARAALAEAISNEAKLNRKGRLVNA